MVHENSDKVRKLLNRALSDLNQASMLLAEEDVSSIPMDLTSQLANVKRAHKDLRLHWIALLDEQGVGLSIIKTSTDAASNDCALSSIIKGRKIRQKLRGV